MSQEESERNFAFIVNQQAKFFADIEELKTLATRTDAKLTRAIRLAIIEARQEREKRRQLEETFTAKLNARIDAQIRTEESVSTFKSQIKQALTESEDRRVKGEEQLRQTIEGNEARRAQGEEQLRQVLAQMARAIVATNQRIDNELSKQNGQP